MARSKSKPKNQCQKQSQCTIRRLSKPSMFKQKSKRTTKTESKTKISKVNIQLSDSCPQENYSAQWIASPKATSVTSRTSSNSKKRKKTQEYNLSNLSILLDDRVEKHGDSFDFWDYLGILKLLKLVSKKLEDHKEQVLVAKSWHLISYFENGNIVTNSNNIKTFISGVLGVTEKWMFKTHPANDMAVSYRPSELIQKESQTTRMGEYSHFFEGFEGSKIFKFRNKMHVKELQNEFMPLKLRKFDSEINSKTKCFSYSDNSDSSKRNSDNFKDTQPTQEENEIKKEIEIEQLMVGSSFIFRLKNKTLSRQSLK